jgi:hypothetical protein
MKKIILLILIFSCFSQGFSQSKKIKKPKSKTSGTKTSKVVVPTFTENNQSKFEVAVAGGFDLEKGINNLSRNYAGATLYAGYFINPKTEVGAQATKTFISDAENIGFGVFARRYFNKFYAGLQGNRTNYTVPKKDDFNNSYKTYQCINSLGIQGGYRFEVSKHIKLENAININLILNNQSKIASTGYGLRVGLIYGF